MFKFCSPFLFIDLFASGYIILLGVLWLVQRKLRRGREQVDGNQRLMIQLTLLAVLADGMFLLFVFSWRPC